MLGVKMVEKLYNLLNSAVLVSYLAIKMCATERRNKILLTIII